MNSSSYHRLFSLILPFFLAVFSWVNASGTFPFPTSGNYTTHIKPSTNTTTVLNQHVTDFYELWKTAYLKSDCGDYYIWVKDNKKTVSEAHGYGMMLFAYFAGYDANAKQYFDGLYQYFRKNPSRTSNDLMDWEQETCNDASSNMDNSASDGDIDIAYALLLAHVQWGSSGTINYLEEARKVIRAIMEHDINHETWTVKLGDWSTKFNGENFYYATRTSDFIPSHFRAFADATGNDNWNKVINKCYELVNKMQSNYAGNTGLLPDFIINTNTNPAPAPASPKFLESEHDGRYYYNACRNTWRLGVDYLLHGETRALNAVKKINDWLAYSTGNDATKIAAGYHLDGTAIGNYFDASFVGPLTVGGMLDSSKQNWLNSLYSSLNSSSSLSGYYYGDTIKLLSLLSVSGNYWTPPKDKITPAQTTSGPTHGKYVVGYYAQWAIYGRNYLVSDIDASKLTHLMYAFFDTKYDANTDTAFIKTLDKNADFDHTKDPGITYSSPLKGNMGALKLLKDNNPHLNILISLGGWTKSQAFPALASSANGRKTLAESMVNFMNQYPFIDGFDIDWEFPVHGGTDGSEIVNGNTIPAQPHTPNDHKNLVLLLKEMRQKFDAAFPNEHKWVTMAGGNNVANLLSTHVGPGNQGAHGMTENIADYSDFITFFGYDFGGNWFDKTSYNAPLYPSNNPEDPLYRTKKDAMYAGSGIPQQALDDLVTLYLDHLKIPKEKLVMGVPFYGRLFEQVVDGTVETGLPGLFRSAPRWDKGSCNGPRPPKGTWDAADCEQSGSIAFCDISQGVSLTSQQSHKILDSNDLSKVSSTAAAAGWKKYWDNTAKVPYLYNTQTKQFITYDDKQSLAEKINYIKLRDLGGAMIWELSEDTRKSFGGNTYNNPTELLTHIGSTFADIKVDLTVDFKTPQNVAIDGVKVELLDSNGTVVNTVNSNGSGTAVFSQVEGIKAYTIRFSKSGYAFLPENITIKALDLTANKSFSITGSSNVVSFSGTTTVNGVLGATDVVLYDSSKNELKRIQSNAANGTFTIDNIIGGGDYILTAEKTYHTFNSIAYNNQTTSVSGIKLVGEVNKHTISGTVKDSSGSGINGVTLTLSGGSSAQTTSNTQGYYEFKDIEAGKNYTLTPSKTGLIFKPISEQFTPLAANEVVDFQKDEGYIYGYVKDGSTPLSNVTMLFILNWASNSLPYAGIMATTDAAGRYVFKDEFISGGTTYKISDYAAANAVGKLQVQSGTTQTLMPSSYDFAAGQLPTQSERFDFNTKFPSPSITIKSPSTNPITITVGGDVALEATIEISPQDSSITLSTVSFEIGGKTITPTASGSTYTATWKPAASDFDSTHSFKVSATASNNESSSETFDFKLECSGSGCPNKKPNITWVLPSNTTVNQASGFVSIPVEVTVTDTDGSVQSVNISVDGGTTQRMTSGANNAYTYRFTPSAYKKHTLQITATDNAGDSSTLTQEINVVNSSFVPLPKRVNVGYYHSWDSSKAPFIYLEDVIGTKYNVVVYSFIETKNKDGYTPVLTVNDKAPSYQTNGAYDKSKLKADIKKLQASGIPVLVSIGGQNGHVELNTTAEKKIFVDGVIAILNEYGFDGLDIDFEGSSMNFGAGALTNFSYASVSNFPKLKNVIDAIKEIDTQMGAGFHITAAPEVQYVQQGSSNFLDNWGSFLPVVHHIRDILDYIHVQLYNIGARNGVKGLDGKGYFQGHPDLIVSACESLIRGFKTAGPGIQFNGLRADQVAIGLPATESCPNTDGGAAGGGFVKTSDVEKAIKYLTQGTSFGGSYSLQGGPYPNLRGAMTWSINWDKSTACGSGVYEYANNIDMAFNGITLSEKDVKSQNIPLLYPNPANKELTIHWSYDGLVEVIITNALGQQVEKSTHHFDNENTIHLNVGDLPKGVLFLHLNTVEKESYVSRFINE